MLLQILAKQWHTILYSKRSKVHTRYKVYILNNETIHAKDTISAIENIFIKTVYTHQTTQSLSAIHITLAKNTGLEFKASL
jgi:hypothetical protein